MKTKIIFFLSILSLLLFSCEDDIKKPLVTNDVIPPPPRNIQIDNQPGAVKISYTLPDEVDMLYVMAVFSTRGGVERVVKSSVFKNYVVLDGFGESREYQVTLYSVSRSENRSEPVTVTVNPLKAPIHVVFDSMVYGPTFGGINISVENEDQNEFTIVTLIKDSVSGGWTEYDRIYTSAVLESFAVRGFNSVPTDFAVYLVDKWKNHSDTLIQTLTPLFEVEFDKSLWLDANLSDDFNVPRYGALSQLWTPGPTTYFFMKQDMVGLRLPNWVTIDLGRRYIFGRMLIELTNHHNNWKYTQGTPKTFEIWGSNEPSTDWEVWTLLGAFEIVKPSGLPVGQLTADDHAKAEVGHEFDFPYQENSFRYIRFKTLTTFGGNADVNFREITLWGQPFEE